MMTRLAVTKLPLLSALGLLIASAFANGTEVGFARVDTDDNGRPRALQLAIAHYEPADGRAAGTAVDLVSAVHVGDASYYADLNERFTGYDTVLYELVAPEGAVITKDTEKTGIVSGGQRFMTRALDLSFQLDEIDYTVGNFVHADLSGPELREHMAARDESLYTYFWRVFYAVIRETARDPLGMRDLQMIASSTAVDGQLSFKTMLAYEIANNQSLEEIFGEDADSSIIGARNARAIEVLRLELDRGATRVGIFYGVGHMPDFDAKLVEIGYERTGTTWIDAWQLGEPATQ